MSKCVNQLSTAEYLTAKASFQLLTKYLNLHWVYKLPNANK